MVTRDDHQMWPGGRNGDLSTSEGHRSVGSHTHVGHSVRKFELSIGMIVTGEPMKLDKEGQFVGSKCECWWRHRSEMICE